ncbi:Orexin receptor type 1 [Lamellibrachia satsuma]|nr:Orexin receptor type 1 [Lamellibrachia satsuma]
MMSPDLRNDNASAMDSYDNRSAELQQGYADGSWITEEVLRRIRDEFLMYRKPSSAVLIALYGVTFLLGSIGNVLVICVFVRSCHMRTVTNSFLVNLAVCDLMVVLGCMPFSVAIEIYENWIYGDVMCRLVNFSQGLSVSASILTLTVISAERFYAIRRPLQALAVARRHRLRWIIACIWIVAALAVLPGALMRREHIVIQVSSLTVSKCVESWPAPALKHAYNFTLVGVLYAAPIVFVSVGYLRIAASLWKTDSRLHADCQAARSSSFNSSKAARRKVAKMLFVMALLFAVSWLPIHCLGIVIDFLRPQQLATHGDLLFHLHSYALWLGHANSVFNPACYYVMNRRFRSAVKRQFVSLCCIVRTPVFRRERWHRHRPRVAGTGPRNEASIEPMAESQM